MAVTTTTLTPTSIRKPTTSTHLRAHSSSSPQISSSRSSSAQIWAEDYYDSNLQPQPQPQNLVSLGDVHDQIEVLTPLPPVTTTTRPFPRSIPINCDEEQATPRQHRTHKRALTALLPFKTIPANSDAATSGSATLSSSSSPTTQIPLQQEDDNSMPSFTGDKNGAVSTPAVSTPAVSTPAVSTPALPARGFTGWFSGASSPATVNLPADDEILTSPSPSTTASTTGRLRNMTISSPPAATPTPKPASVTKSRFSFFSAKPSPTPPQPLHTTPDQDDLLTLSLAAALSPANAPHDPFSPAASKNLHTTALTLLTTFQTSYRARCTQLHELRLESSARTDELDEAETRNRHLKAQLEEMARRVEEQDETLRAILDELVVERQRSADEGEARERERERSEAREQCLLVPGEGGGRASEDLNVERRRKRRSDNSDLTTRSSVPDAMFESDAESAIESVWSARCLSPESSMSAATEVVYSCENCEGRDASVAWQAVRGLKRENNELKGEMDGLRGAVEDALGLVGGLGGR